MNGTLVLRSALQDLDDYLFGWFISTVIREKRDKFTHECIIRIDSILQY